MNRGRPTKYKKEYCEKLVKHMSKGLSFETFAVTEDLGLSTIKQWIQKHPDFAAARKRGRLASQLFWEKLGIGLASGKLKSGNTGIWIYNMKCRFPDHWSPTSHVTITGRYAEEVKKIERMTTEELLEAASSAKEYLEGNKDFIDIKAIDVES